MDFQLTDEQVELQRIAREVVERECPPSLVRAVVEDDADTDALWKTLVGLEWPGLTVPVEHGGSGATAVELVVVLEELGWAADPTPFLATTTQHLPLVPRAACRARCGPSGSPPSPLAARAPRCSTPDAIAARRRRRRLGARRAPPRTCSTATGPTSSRSSPATERRRSACSSSPATTSPRPASRRSTPASTCATVRLDGVRVPAEPAAAGPTWRRPSSGPATRRVTGLAAVDGRRVAADLRPRARPHRASATSSACRSARSRPSSTWPSTCTSPSSGPGPSSTSRRWPSPRTTTGARSPRRWPRRPPAMPSASPRSTASSSSAASATRGRTTCSSTCGGPRPARCSSAPPTSTGVAVSRLVLARLATEASR